MYRDKCCPKCQTIFLPKSGAQAYCGVCKAGNRLDIKSLGNVHRGMLSRCYNNDANDYKWYGERGITVCYEWLSSKAVFKAWAISNGFKRGLHLDRIDANGMYAPGNCRFVTPQVNMNNRRNKKTYLEYGTRICNKCGVIKKLNEFHKSGNDWHYTCRVCRNLSRRKAKNIL